MKSNKLRWESKLSVQIQCDEKNNSFNFYENGILVIDSISQLEAKKIIGKIGNLEIVKQYPNQKFYI